MPARVALALQADGWWIRQDIIWSKPNPMPESITDRCTKAHEYLFLLAKSERYLCDMGAIREPASEGANARRATVAGWAAGPGAYNTIEHAKTKPGRRKLAQIGSGIKNNSSFDAAMAVMPEWRNKRSVWTVPTFAYPEAHFATFPPALIEPCILAGSRPGDVVFDPFMGSGTTAMVASSLGRQYLGCELSPEYEAMSRSRASQIGMVL
jgi:site-specific DNA-methyltransferase (cytosine-N4-specific)